MAPKKSSEIQVFRYSESFKLSIVRGLEEGKYRTVQEAAVRHGVGHKAVTKWVKQLGNPDVLPKMIHVTTHDDMKTIKELKEENRKLRFALSDAHLDLRIASVQLALACERGGLGDPEEFKKKAASTPHAAARKIPDLSA